MFSYYSIITQKEKNERETHFGSFYSHSTSLKHSKTYNNHEMNKYNKKKPCNQNSQKREETCMKKKTLTSSCLDEADEGNGVCGAKKLESWTRIEARTGLQWSRRRSLVQVFPWFTYIKLKCPNRLRIGGVTDLHTHTCHVQRLCY